MGASYYIRIKEHVCTESFPRRGQLDQWLSTNFYHYSDNKLAESSDGIEHKNLHTTMTVLSTHVYPEKSFHIVRGDWSVPSEEEEVYAWQDLRPEVRDGYCTLRYAGDAIKPSVNTQVSWLQALAGASNISECSEAQELRAAGDPAIFWALIALTIERDEQPSQLIAVVNQKDWKKPPQENQSGRIVIVEIYGDHGAPESEDYGFPDP